VKLIQEKIGNTQDHRGIGNDFMNRNLIAQQLKKKLTNGLHEIKKVLHSKGNGHQTDKTAYRMGEKFLLAIYLTRD
jgi:hypothetical protein